MEELEQNPVSLPAKDRANVSRKASEKQRTQTKRDGREQEAVWDEDDFGDRKSHVCLRSPPDAEAG